MTEEKKSFFLAFLFQKPILIGAQTWLSQIKAEFSSVSTPVRLDQVL